jgi:putative DNA primase/helicase
MGHLFRGNMNNTFNKPIIHENQLWYGKEDKWIWIANVIWIKAKTKGEGGCGRLLMFVDDEGKSHEIFIQMSELSGKCEVFFSKLMDAGFLCSNRKTDRDIIVRYIIQTPVKQCIERVSRTGWFNDVYVLPDKVFGKSETPIICTAQNIHQQKGSLAEWQSNVACYCVGNSRLILGICAAFASSVLKVFNRENVGFNITGPSSSGKTTCLKVASSVFGAPLSSWRTTDNGLEGVALDHNDSLLILDELSQMDPYKIGDAIYMLANGVSKGRADKHGTAQKINKWRLLFLSSGETNLALHMKSARQKANAGQELRFINIQAEALQSGETKVPRGIFENLHGFNDGAVLAQYLSAKALDFKGSAIGVFLEKITQDLEDIKSYHADLSRPLRLSYEKQHLSGQNKRVLEHFIFLSVIGEYARFVTGWESGEATKGCMKCFDDWLENEGNAGLREEQQIIEQVQLFFEQHAESRLQDLNDSTSKVVNMVGYKDESAYYITPQAFKAVLCRGWSFKTVIDALTKKGCLEKQDGVHSVRKKIRGRLMRLYKIDQASLDIL